MSSMHTVYFSHSSLRLQKTVEKLMTEEMEGMRSSERVIKGGGATTEYHMPGFLDV